MRDQREAACQGLTGDRHIIPADRDPHAREAGTHVVGAARGFIVNVGNVNFQGFQWEPETFDPCQRGHIMRGHSRHCLAGWLAGRGEASERGT